MWSPLAEQIVSRLIAALPPDKLDPSRTHAARLMALPIGVSLWADYYLRPNGELVIVGEDIDQPDEESVYSDQQSVFPVLAWASEQYPELKALLPVRGSTAIDCPICQSVPLFATGKVRCPRCAGLHWVDPT
jgi:hypothetical protein